MGFLFSQSDCNVLKHRQSTEKAKIKAGPHWPFLTHRIVPEINSAKFLLSRQFWLDLKNCRCLSPALLQVANLLDTLRLFKRICQLLQKLLDNVALQPQQLCFSQFQVITCSYQAVICLGKTQLCFS